MFIGGSNFLFGIAATIGILDIILQALGLSSTPSAPFASASIDSEFRFYAVFWFAYGGLLWRTADRLDTHFSRAGWLIGLFAIGGIGRLLSLFFYGLPAPLFVIVTIVELVLTLLMAFLWLAIQRGDAA